MLHLFLVVPGGRRRPQEQLEFAPGRLQRRLTTQEMLFRVARVGQFAVESVLGELIVAPFHVGQEDENLVGGPPGSSDGDAIV